MNGDRKVDSGACLFLLNNLIMAGSEKKVVRIANQLVFRGHTIHVAVLNGPYDLQPALNQNVHVKILDRVGKFDFGAAKKLRGYICKKNISKIVCVNLYPMLYAFGAVRSFRRKVDLYVSINTTKFPEIYRNLQMFIYTPLIWGMDCVIFGNEEQRRKWSRHFFINMEKSCTIYNGVDKTRYTPEVAQNEQKTLRQAWQIEQGNIVLGMVAEFRREKSHPDLIKAVSLLVSQGYDVKVLLVGNGPDLEKIRNLVSDLDLKKRVIFLGLQADVRPALGLMDVFVLTSTAETFSNAALEAMAMGKPVVLSRHWGASEMVEESVNGYLYPPGDIEQLTSALKKLIDGGEMAAMGRASRRIVENRFSLDAMVDQFERVIWGRV